MIYRRSLTLLALLALLVSSSCGGTSTDIFSRWIEPGLKPVPMKKVLVIGIGENQSTRKAFEETLSWRLTQRNINAMPASRIVPKGGENDPVAIKKAIDGEGFDGALVSRVVSRDTKLQGGGGVSVGIGFSDYYGRGMVVGGSSEPDVKAVDVVRLETACWIFNDGKARMVWTTLSDTTDLSKLEEAIINGADTLLDSLKKDGLI